MIDLGTVRPGSTIRIPFSTFDKDDGSSITMTDYAAADILIYKDGSDTERASTSGYTATADFDGKTGKHLAIINLADDDTADFFKAGSEYLVAINAVTVDGVTTGGWIARFRIGYPNAYLDTSIATLASQTSFTLTSGPAEDDALNGMVLLIHDKASAIQVTRVVVEDYTGSTKTVTLRAAPPATFTIAAGDNVSAVGFDEVRVVSMAAGVIFAASFAADTEGYSAKLWLTVDDTTDYWSVIWNRNGQDQDPDDITTPLIKVISRAGADLIAAGALTPIGGNGYSLKYDAEDAERLPAGPPGEIVLTATIGGSPRVWRWNQGRDA